MSLIDFLCQTFELFSCLELKLLRAENDVDVRGHMFGGVWY